MGFVDVNDGGSASAPKRVHEQRIPNQGEIAQRGNINGVDAIRLPEPGTEIEQSARVAAPGRPRPAQALREEFRIAA